MASTGWEEEDETVTALGLVNARTKVFREEYSAKILSIRWLGETRRMYFKSGPVYHLSPGAGGAEPVRILATYEDSSVAAFMSGYGRGKVVACGPHPEARASWRDDLVEPGDWKPEPQLAVDLLIDLLSDRPVMRP